MKEKTIGVRTQPDTGIEPEPDTLTLTMKIGPKPLDQYPRYLRPFFWNQRRKYGSVLDSPMLWARSPKLFLGVADSSSFDAAERVYLEYAEAMTISGHRISDELTAGLREHFDDYRVVVRIDCLLTTVLIDQL